MKSWSSPSFEQRFPRFHARRQQVLHLYLIIMSPYRHRRTDHLMSCIQYLSQYLNHHMKNAGILLLFSTASAIASS